MDAWRDGNGFVSFNKSISLKHFNANLNIDDLFDLFEPGHLDTLSFRVICFSLNNLSKYGIKKLKIKLMFCQTMLKNLKKKILSEKIRKRENILIFSILKETIKSITNFKHKIICSKEARFET